MPLKTDYTDLEKKIPLANLLCFHEMFSRMDDKDEQRMLSLLQRYSLNVSNGDYQLPIQSEEDYHVLKGRLADLARSASIV